MLKSMILIGMLAISAFLLWTALKWKTKWTSPIKKGSLPDRAVSFETEEKNELHLTREAIGQTPRHVQKRVHISQEWFAKTTKAYQQAYSLSMLARQRNNDGYPKNFHNLLRLYRMNLSAGKQLHETEKNVQRKISEMQKRKHTASRADVQQIEEIIRRLAKIQSNIAKKRINCWNYTHVLKTQISRCGNEGAAWYSCHQKRKE